MNIKFISGVMRTGKTAELISIYLKELSKNKVCFSLKPLHDTRDIGIVKSRVLEQTLPAFNLDSNDEIHIRTFFNIILTNKIDILFIDEVQFFNKEFINRLLDICKILNMNIICSGLVTDFNEKYFESSRYLLDNSDEFDFHEGFCYKCGKRNAEWNILLDKNNVRIIRQDNNENNSIVPEDVLKTLHYETVCDMCIDSYDTSINKVVGN